MPYRHHFGADIFTLSVLVGTFQKEVSSSVSRLKELVQKKSILTDGLMALIILTFSTETNQKRNILEDTKETTNSGYLQGVGLEISIWKETSFFHLMPVSAT